MNLYTCNVLHAPLRCEASHRSEMISELLFGEKVFVLDDESDFWVKVQCEWDDYIGWILKSQIEENSIFEKSLFYKNTQFFPNIKIINDSLNQSISLENFTETFLHTPYVWGGRSTMGIDCSGLSQLYFKNMDIRIPRDASMQALCGIEVDFSSIEGEDLIFFSSNEKINHVGIYLGNGNILHSTETAGRVVIDQLTVEGIYSFKFQKITHKTKKIVRVKP